MGVIAIPAGLRVGGCVIGQLRFDIEESSDSTGDQAARLLGPSRWRVSLSAPAVLPNAEAAVWQSYVQRGRGKVEHYAIYDWQRQEPRGDMRGAMVLVGSHAKGATTLTISSDAGQANKWLRAADWLQVGAGVGTSQLVSVNFDAQANGSGVVVVSVEAPLRRAYASGTAVTWQRPVAYYKAVQSGWEAEAVGMYGRRGFAFDGIEDWTP